MSSPVNRFFSLVSTALFACAFIGFPSGIFAIDLDGNGRSDVWEAKYGVSPFAANDLDEDGDGHDLWDEALLGTDPSDFHSALTLTWSNDNENLTLTLTGLIGKVYQLESSLDGADVPSENQLWEALDLRVGDGGEIAFSVSLPDSTGVFSYFRVRVIGEVDSDEDGLSQWEENEIGTDDTRTDSDGDHVDDNLEFENGTDPVTTTDTDGDSLPDDWEIHQYGDFTSAGGGVDGDEIPDGWEFANGLDPSVNDAALDNDGDGFSNLEEYFFGGDPSDSSIGLLPPAQRLRVVYLFNTVTAGQSVEEGEVEWFTVSASDAHFDHQAALAAYDAAQDNLDYYSDTEILVDTPPELDQVSGMWEWEFTFRYRVFTLDGTFYSEYSYTASIWNHASTEVLDRNQIESLIDSGTDASPDLIDSHLDLTAMQNPYERHPTGGNASYFELFTEPEQAAGVGAWFTFYGIDEYGGEDPGQAASVPIGSSTLVWLERIPTGIAKFDQQSLSTTFLRVRSRADEAGDTVFENLALETLTLEADQLVSTTGGADDDGTVLLSQPPPVEKEDSVSEILLPVELLADLNNDGEITTADSILLDKAQAPNATEEDIHNGTEYCFANDKFSNGVWDVDDEGAHSVFYPNDSLKLPTPPSGHTRDDDAEAVKVTLDLDFGKVWFEHPAISHLKFYSSSECKESDELSLKYDAPFDLSEGTLPDYIYLRLSEEWAGIQADGDLRMFLGSGVSDIWLEKRLPLTIVREFGAEHFFHAARDYILENNTTVYIREHGYPYPSPSVVFRICVMREEATELIPFDAYTPYVRGIIDVAQAINDQEPTVILNGNQVFWNAGWDEWTDPQHWPDMFGHIAERCHGRLISNGVTSPVSSDNFDTTTTPAPGSPLAGPDPIPDTDPPEPGGKYVSHSGAWNFAAGMADGTDALGGLSTYYDSPERTSEEHQMIGFAEVVEDGKGCVFTATQMKGAGMAPVFKGDAGSSGVPDLTPSVDGDAIQLFILDSGAGSLGLIHRHADGSLQLGYIGRKNATGITFYVPTYLAFRSMPPRQ